MPKNLPHRHSRHIEKIKEGKKRFTLRSHRLEYKK